MFKNLILHVGQHKTATSALQKVLNHNRQKLMEQDIYYPSAGQWGDHAHHPWAFAVEKRKNGDGRALETLFEDLGRELRPLRHRPDTVLLSSEIFEKYPFQEPLLPHLDYFLGRLADSATAVIFFRRQDILVESVFKQWVKEPALQLKMGFAPFAESQISQMNFFQIAQKWNDMHHIRAVKISTDPIDDKTVARFFALLGVHTDGFKLDFGIVNRSLDGVPLELKYHFNRRKRPEEIDEKVLNVLRDPSFAIERTRLFGEAERARYIANFGPSNQRLFEQYGSTPFSTDLNVAGRMFAAPTGAQIDSFLNLLETRDKALYQYMTCLEH